jgi:hypothetical protein
LLPNQHFHGDAGSNRGSEREQRPAGDAGSSTGSEQGPVRDVLRLRVRFQAENAHPPHQREGGQGLNDPLYRHISVLARHDTSSSVASDRRSEGSSNLSRVGSQESLATSDSDGSEDSDLAYLESPEHIAALQQIERETSAREPKPTPLTELISDRMYKAWKYLRRKASGSSSESSSGSSSGSDSEINSGLAEELYKRIKQADWATALEHNMQAGDTSASDDLYTQILAGFKLDRKQTKVRLVQAINDWETIDRGHRQVKEKLIQLNDAWQMLGSRDGKDAFRRLAQRIKDAHWHEAHAQDPHYGCDRLYQRILDAHTIDERNIEKRLVQARDEWQMLGSRGGEDALRRLEQRIKNAHWHEAHAQDPRQGCERLYQEIYKEHNDGQHITEKLARARQEWVQRGSHGGARALVAIEVQINTTRWHEMEIRGGTPAVERAYEDIIMGRQRNRAEPIVGPRRSLSNPLESVREDEL